MHASPSRFYAFDVELCYDYKQPRKDEIKKKQRFNASRVQYLQIFAKYLNVVTGHAE